MIDFRKRLQEFDRDYSYDPEKGGKRRPGVDSLKDGTYTFTIIEAIVEEVGDDDQLVFRLVLKERDSGEPVEHTYWLNNQVSVNILGQDLVTLDIDADQWTGKRRFSEELFKVIQAEVLVGLRFKGVKKTEEKKGKTYHRLYVNWPLGRDTGMDQTTSVPTTPKPPIPPQTARRPAPRPQQEAEVFAAPDDDDDDEIPF